MVLSDPWTRLPLLLLQHSATGVTTIPRIPRKFGHYLSLGIENVLAILRSRMQDGNAGDGRGECLASPYSLLRDQIVE